jgi:dTDP-4-dehydrorhamnose reductase
MSSSSKIVVLGSGGLLGTHLVRELERVNMASQAVASRERLNSSVEVSDHLTTLGASTVVNCIGYGGAERANHFQVNGCLPRAVADWSERNGAFCILISTNAVFAPSTSRHWLPSDKPAPRTDYEIAKLFGEAPNAYIIRASFIGRSSQGRSLLDRLLAGQPYVERMWNGVTASALAARIVELIRERDGKAAKGIEHVHSPRATSIRRLVKLLESSSQSQGSSDDGRLLGGGRGMPDIDDQLREYLRRPPGHDC